MSNARNTMKRNITIPSIMLAAVFMCGCAPNAIMFHETAKFGFDTQYKPDSSQPVNVTLGFKRRIVAIVPSKEVDEGAPQKTIVVKGHGSEQDKVVQIPKGEALSMVSRFDVVAEPTNGVHITNYFVTGTAAVVLTRGPNAAKAVENLLTAPATLQALDPQLQSRRRALVQKLGGMNEGRAEAWLAQAGAAKHRDTAIASMQDVIKVAQSIAAVEKLEAAFARVP